MSNYTWEYYTPNQQLHDPEQPGLSGAGVHDDPPDPASHPAVLRVRRGSDRAGVAGQLRSLAAKVREGETSAGEDDVEIHAADTCGLAALGDWLDWLAKEFGRGSGPL